MRERIIGAETEYALFYEQDDKTLQVWFENKFLRDRYGFFDFLPDDIRQFYFPNQLNFLPNGARFYMDSGSHPEYATQEARFLHDLLLYERVGDVMMEEVVALMSEKTIHPKGRFRIFKNNLALDFGNNVLITYGAHENYHMPRLAHTDPAGRVMREVLVPFLITRPVIAGSGSLFARGDRFVYVLSQRPCCISEVANPSTTASRAIINTRDEPHADEEKYRRLHLIIGDSLMADVARLMKFGSTMMVLDMIETGFCRESFFGEISDEEFLRAMREFNSDPTLAKPRKLGNGSYTIVEVQQMYVNAAKEFCGCFGSNPEYDEVLGYWEMLLEYAKEEYPHRHLAKYVDWARKLCDLEGNMEKKGFDWNTPATAAIRESKKRDGRPYTLFNHLKQIDYCFSELSPRGLARMHEAVGTLIRLVSAEDIARYRLLPKSNTRAYRRAVNYRLAQRMLESGKATTAFIDWGFVHIQKDDFVVYHLDSKDPFAADPCVPPDLWQKYLSDINLS